MAAACVSHAVKKRWTVSRGWVLWFAWLKMRAPSRAARRNGGVVLRAGHFAWEQASDEYGRLIVDWVTGGFQPLGGAVGRTS